MTYTKTTNLTLLVFALFLSNTFIVGSTNVGSPDSCSSSSPPSLSSTTWTPVESIDNTNSDSTEALELVEDFTTVTIAIGGTENTSSIDIPLWKQQLPFPLNNKTKTLQRILIPGDGYQKENDISSISSDVEVFVLGTAHISKDSSRDVRQLLESVKPDAIFLELCHQRLNLLEESENDKNNIHQQDERNKVTPSGKSNTTVGFWNQYRGMFRRGQKSRPNRNDSNKKRIDTKSFSSIASSLLSNMQGEYADSLEVELGGEFRAAYKYWRRVVPYNCSSYSKLDWIKNVHMILGDRPVTLTLTRAWESLRIWGKFKLLVGLFISSLRKPNPDEVREWMEKILYGDTDLMSESVTELAKHFPTLAEVILKERDAYMACKLHQTCRRLSMIGSRYRSNPRCRVVAIVGAGHVEGICKWLLTGGSSETISTLASPMNLSSTEAKSSKMAGYFSQVPPESPEDILSKLIQTKANIPKEDHDYLVHQITELDPKLINNF